MKLKIVTREGLEANAKLTVHHNGRTGFSSGAIKRMNIDEKTYLRIAVNDEDKNDTSLYVFVSKEKTLDSIKVNKAGHYYYLNTRLLYEDLGLDYKRKKIIFDIYETEYEGARIFKLIRREKSKEKKAL